jgi:hypothetical protein
MARRLLRGDEHTADIHRHHAVEVIKGELVERHHHRNPRIIDQHVEAAEGSHRLGDGAFYRLGVGAVGTNGQGPTPPAVSMACTTSSAFCCAWA